MKVLYVLHNTSTDGSLLTWMQMVCHLQKKGVNIVVVCPPELNNISQFVEFCAKCNCTIHFMPVQQSVKGMPPLQLGAKIKWLKKWCTAPWRKLKFFKRLLKVVKAENPDIIHTNVGVVHEGVWVALYLKIPHVWHLREYQDLGCNYWIYPTKQIFEKVLRLSTIIAITTDIREHFHLLNYQKAYVIHDGVYHKYEYASVAKKSQYFLCVSRIHPQKCIDEAIRAFAKIATDNPEYRLLLAGNGLDYYIEELKYLAQELNVGDRVFFLGFCERSKVKELMQNAKALLVPSNYEGFGLMTAEALFNGCLVIGKNNGGTAEILKEAGGIPYKETEDSLALAMTKVLEMSEDEYNMIIEHARKIAINKYSIENNTDEIYKIYTTLTR